MSVESVVAAIKGLDTPSLEDVRKLVHVAMGHLKGKDFGDTSQLLDPSLVSFEELREGLLSYAQGRGGAWRDWLSSSDSMIIVELLAGIGAFVRNSQLTMQREMSLDHAQLDVSVYELAANRGVLVPPCRAVQFEVEVPEGLSFREGERVGSLNVGEAEEGSDIGGVGGYGLYVFGFDGVKLTLVVGSLVFDAGGERGERGEGVEPSGEGDRVGVFNTFVFPSDGNGYRNRYVARQLERFGVGLEEVNDLGVVKVPELRSDPAIVSAEDGVFDPSSLVRTGDFVLRRVLPHEVRVYTGNTRRGGGIPLLGWSSDRNVFYRALTFGDDHREVAAGLRDGSVKPLWNTDKVPADTGVDSVRGGDTGLLGAGSREVVRVMSRYYPSDGNLTHDRHYEALVLKYFSTEVWDVLSYNTNPAGVPGEDPVQVVLVIEKDGGVGGLLGRVRRLVDQRRMLALVVEYRLAESYLDWEIEVRGDVSQDRLDAWVRDNRLNRFYRGAETLRAGELLSEVSDDVGGAVYVDPVWAGRSGSELELRVERGSFFGVREDGRSGLRLRKVV